MWNWQKIKTGSKSGFDAGWKALDKLGAPVNKLSNKLGSEAFWPTTLDKESDKAARILKSFCKDGFYAEEEYQPIDGPKQRQRVLKKIPESVIRNAKGLAIFTTMRSGLWVSGAGGSGVLVAKKEDGSWSPPSGILLHTAGLGFLIGVDIYDCVLVLNTAQALESFKKLRCTLGGEVSVVAGPVGIGGVLDTEVHTRQAPVFTYMKSRGFYAGVQIDGTIIIERFDENARFYGQELPVQDILAGKVRHPPYEVRRLMETIKSAQGDTDYDSNMIPEEAPPGDYEIDDGHVFGVPDREDPDPYGVLALEKEGMSLRESGTQKRASWEQFSFTPSPSSPVHSIYARSSHEGTPSRPVSTRSSWRASAVTSDPRTPSSLRNSVEFNAVRSSPVQMADSSTQTEFPGAPPPLPFRDLTTGLGIAGKRGSRGSGSSLPAMADVPEHEAVQDEKMEEKRSEFSDLDEENRTKQNRHEDGGGSRSSPSITHNGYSTPPTTPPPTLGAQKDALFDQDHLDDDDDYDDDDLQIIDEPVVHSVQNVQPAATQVASKIRLVEVPKRTPPKLPPRNPNRSPAAAGAASSDNESTASPIRDEADAKSNASTSPGPALRDMTASLRDIDLDDEDEDDDDDDDNDDEIRARLREAEEMSRQYEELKGAHGQLTGSSG